MTLSRINTDTRWPKKQRMTTPDTKTDAKLLSSMLAGDEQALAALYRRRQGNVYRFALQMSGSPALADEGAALRHPEVMECDARWREQNSHELIFQETLNFDGLAESVGSIQRLERLRMEFDHASNHEGLRRLTEAVQSSKEECLLLAKSPIVEAERRAEASEVAEWLGVWLKQPEIFADWIELRKRSGDFVERFGDTFS